MFPAKAAASGGAASDDVSRRWPWLVLVGAVIALAILVIGPGRQMMPEDDGWAYARSVLHLLQTGQYRLDAWAAAGMPVQIGLAAGLSSLLGYSLGLLEATTVALLCVGLVSLMQLLQEWGASRPRAAAMTLAFAAAPGVMLLSFSFMSDIQFVGWVLLACWLYVRGLKRHSTRSLLAASVALACAIGTRQFGLAVLAGMGAGLLLARWRGDFGWRMVFAALVIPTAAAAGQLLAGLETPTFTQAVRLNEQHWYWSHPVTDMAAELAWRCAMLLRYLGLLLLPATPLVLARWWAACRSRPLAGVGLTAGAALLLLALSHHTSFTMRPLPAGAHWPVFTVLPLYWMLPNWIERFPAVEATLALMSFPMGAALAVIAVRSALAAGPARWSAAAFGMVVSFLLLAGLHLSYVQLNDTYTIGLLPFAAMLIGTPMLAARSREHAWPTTLTLLLAIVCLALTSLLMRSDRNRQEAAWIATDRLLARGVDPARIGAGRHWSEYHGAFDRWLAETGKAAAFARNPKQVPHHGDLHTPFYAWMGDQSYKADYLVLSPGEPVPPGWNVVEKQSYTNWRGVTRNIVVIHRSGEQKGG